MHPCKSHETTWVRPAVDGIETLSVPSAAKAMPLTVPAPEATSHSDTVAPPVTASVAEDATDSAPSESGFAGSPVVVVIEKPVEEPEQGDASDSQ